MRGCLKHHSPSSSTIATPPPTRGHTPPLIPPDAPSLAPKRRPLPTLTDECLTRRCVHFCSQIVDKIYVADEWDRSPAQVTPRLTYQDMLELKEIQRSLPHATQSLDKDLPELDVRGVPRTHFLNNVPVGLVPLIGPTVAPTSHPESVTAPHSSKVESRPSSSSPHSHPPPSPPSTPPPKSSATKPPPSLNRPKPPSPPACKDEPWVPPPPPPRLPYNIPIQPRPIPRFQFLPLLETPAQPTTVSASSGYDRTPEKCLSPSLTATSRHSQPRTSPARTPSPRDSSLPQSQQSRHSPSFPSTIGEFESPGDSKEGSLEDSHLEAELSRLWHSNTDGETEAEESEAESSVVHTEAESDGEYTHGSVPSGGARKVVRTPVVVTTAADADDEEMSLVDGVITFFPTPRRR